MQTMSMQPMPPTEKLGRSILEETSRVSILSGNRGVFDERYIPYRFKTLAPQVVAASMPSYVRVPGHAATHAAHLVCAVASGAPHTETLCLLAAFDDPMGETLAQTWAALREVHLQKSGATVHHRGCDLTRLPPPHLRQLEPELQLMFYHAADEWSVETVYDWHKGGPGGRRMSELRSCNSRLQGSAAEVTTDVNDSCSGDHWCFRFEANRATNVTIFKNDKLGVDVSYPGDFHDYDGMATWIDTLFAYGVDTDGSKLFNAVRYYEDFHLGVWRGEPDDDAPDPTILRYYRHYKLHQQRQWFELAMRRLEKRFFYTLKERAEHRRGDHLPGGAQHEAAKEGMEELQALDDPAAKVARLEL